MILKTIASGFTLSLPAGLLTWIGLGLGPSEAVLGIVFLLGIPWNIFIAVNLLVLIVLFPDFEQRIPFLSSLNINGWLMLMGMAVFASLAGAHINGVLLAKWRESDSAGSGEKKLQSNAETRESSIPRSDT